MRTLFALAIGTTLFAGCRSTPEVETVAIDVPIVETCVPLNRLVAEVVPAETKQVTVITSVENPPYEPIERRETQTRTVREAYTVYRDATGRAVPNSDICGKPAASDPVPDGVRTTAKPGTASPMVDGQVPVMRGVGARDLTRE